MQDTRTALIASTAFPPLQRNTLSTLQVNLGYLCNQSCVHCHVNAGPSRTELMQRETIDLLIEVIAQRDVACLDITGGAPEMNPHFRDLVRAARSQGVEVIDRCNLTILLEPGYEDLIDFLAEQQVTIVASLPCYSIDNVDQQRGKGVFDKSIVALQKLNAAGYGHREELPLNLVYNPQGPSLPPPQQQLQADYQQALASNFGIRFNQLYTITNMPISRFGAVLLAKQGFDDYMALLKDNFSDANHATVMCRELVSVDWQGYLYDCDFNQMLALPLQWHGQDERAHLRDLLSRDAAGSSIAIGEHCFGCTAGQGSSCGGALASD